MSMKTLIAGAALLLAVTGTAAAQSSGGIAADTPWGSGAAGAGGPNIGGNFESDVEVGDVTATARDGSEARNQIGSASSGNVAGNFESDVEAGDVSATAERDSCADNQIGSMGSGICGN